MSNLQTESGQELLLPNAAESCNDNNAEVDTPSINTENIDASKYSPKRSKPCGTQKFMAKMYKLLLKEIGLMVLFALTYAAFSNNPPKVSKSPPAFPFFPKNSIVTDWFRGQLSEAIEQAGESDVAFVMYYAPWDAESQIVRHEFEIAALHLHKEVTFAAINCWHPGSECRTQYNQVFSWPVLMAYAAHSRGVQFRGPRTAPHMIKFLQSISKPLIRISDSAQLNVLLGNHDAVVVGTVNSLHGSAEYGVLYTTALRFLDRDPLAEIAFAVRTEPQKDIYGIQSSPLLTLHLWNETLIYPSDQEWKTDALMAWIGDNLHQVSLWAALPGSKSRTLSPYLQPGPTLILFTPQNPLQGFNDYYDLLRETGLQYYNCEQKPWIQSQIDLIRNKRKYNYKRYKQLLEKCSIKRSSNKNHSFPTVITYNLHARWINSSCCLNEKHKSTCLPCSESQIKEELARMCQSSKENCAKVESYPNIIDKESYKGCKESVHDKHSEYRSKISMYTGHNDHRSPKQIRKQKEQDDCRNFHLAYRVQPFLFTDIVSDDNFYEDDLEDLEFGGLACQTNASLSMIALDSNLYHHFAEGFGIDVLKSVGKTALVIVNDRLEAHYTMMEPYNRPNLQQFMKKFTKNSLSRLLTSTTVQREHTHLYQQKTNCKSSGSHYCINELNTETFLPNVLKQNVAAIVFYYSLQCAFCSGVSYNFLTTAKIFANVSAIQFYRIDGDRNGLPWAFTMDQFPTILFFPAKRKSESRVFSRDMPITVPNLINFILVNLEPNMKLHAMWALCNQSKFSEDKQVCLKQLRAESLELTNSMLREWRNAESLMRPSILHRLQTLRKVSLLLAHKPYDVSAIERLMLKLYHQDLSSVMPTSRMITDEL